MRVMLIPEDFRHDQYIIGPLFKRLMSNLGKPNAKVITCTDPLLGGIGEALKPERLQEICDQYDGMVDIYVLCVDRDGEVGRAERLDAIEQRFSVDGRVFFAVAAIEELETWLLAGIDEPLPASWNEIRAEIHPKETYFLPLSKKMGLLTSPGQGRKILGERAARNCASIIQKCTEDLSIVNSKIAATLT